MGPALPVGRAAEAGVLLAVAVHAPAIHQAARPKEHSRIQKYMLQFQKMRRWELVYRRWIDSGKW